MLLQKLFITPKRLRGDPVAGQSPEEPCSKARRAYSSRYVGVYFEKNIQKWKAQCMVNGKVESIGYFVDEAEAPRHMTSMPRKSAGQSTFQTGQVRKKLKNGQRPRGARTYARSRVSRACTGTRGRIDGGRGLS